MQEPLSQLLQSHRSAIQRPLLLALAITSALIGCGRFDKHQTGRNHSDNVRDATSRVVPAPTQQLPFVDAHVFNAT